MYSLMRVSKNRWVVLQTGSKKISSYRVCNDPDKPNNSLSISSEVAHSEWAEDSLMLTKPLTQSQAWWALALLLNGREIPEEYERGAK